MQNKGQIKMQLKGQFKVSAWDESEQANFPGGGKLTAAKIVQSYEGDISGLSEVNLLMYYGLDGNACFTGFEIISADIDSKQGKLILKHEGKFESGTVKSQFTVMDSSDFAFLQVFSGVFVSTEHGRANYCFG